MTGASSKPAKMKAYQVHDGDEGWAVVFATSGIAARRLGAQEIDCEFSQVESCRRRPPLDQYAPGPVPRMALIAEGWWFECHGCGGRISDEMDDDGHPVEDGAAIYCCDRCRKRYLAERSRKRGVEAETIEAMTGLVLARFPNAQIHSEHAYVAEGDGGWPIVREAFIRFSFPGCRYFGAELRFEEKEEARSSRFRPNSPEGRGLALSVANGDMAAWKRWCDAGYPADMPEAAEAAA